MMNRQRKLNCISLVQLHVHVFLINYLLILHVLTVVLHHQQWVSLAVEEVLLSYPDMMCSKVDLSKSSFSLFWDPQDLMKRNL